MGYVFLDIDECLSKPCLNGGTCHNEVASYSCKCPRGFAGTNCETSKLPYHIALYRISIEITPCERLPCAIKFNQKSSKSSAHYLNDAIRFDISNKAVE